MKALVMNCSPVKNGATAEIVKIVAEDLGKRYEVKTACIDDYQIGFCRGCRSCHQTAKCVQHDDGDQIMELFEWSDILVLVSPSYWAMFRGSLKSLSTDARHGVIHTNLMRLSGRERKAMLLY